MKLELISNPTDEQMLFFEKRIEEFNLARWEVKEKKKFVLQAISKNKIIAGAAGKTFGLWLLLDNLWVSEELRRQGYGRQILEAVENLGRERGCQWVLLETLNFQARPFYEKFGYSLQWTQENYPRDGKKYFMTKELKK